MPEFRSLTDFADCQPGPATTHGGAQFAELRAAGLWPDQVIDFSASVNPFGPTPRVWQAMRGVRLDRYPDPHCTLITEALSTCIGVPSSHLLFGNGATELIHAAARTWASEQRAVVISAHTFGEYTTAASTARADLKVVRPSHAGALDVSVRDLCEALGEHRPSLAFVCNPNNPTGQYYSKHDIEEIVSAAAPGVVILDEAYVAFVQDAWSSLDLVSRWSNLVVLRSMTKDYGITAARLGYAVADPTLIQRMRGALPAWSVNGLAQAAGLAALNDDPYRRRTIEKTARAKRALSRDLTRLNRELVIGAANFVLLEVDDAPEVRRVLLGSGLLVRDCASFGLPRYIRIGVRRQSENRRLVAALERVFGSNVSPEPSKSVQ